jgi:hypothetical protein
MFLQKPDPLVVQKYISPFLIDGLKFDFRFYLLISTLAPYTVYIYREGLARFCTSQYATPRPGNLDHKFVHLTNTSVNKENVDAVGMEFTKLASAVLEKIVEMDPTRGSDLWGQIRAVSSFTMLAVWSAIVSGIQHFNAERRSFSRKPSDSETCHLDSFSKYFHILGIDIMISDACRPLVLELNDRPSMVVTYECEAALKRDLICDAIAHISVDGSPRDDEGNWEKLLPPSPGDPNAVAVNEVIERTSSIFRMFTANRDRPHYEEEVRAQKKPSHATFADSSRGQ